MIYDQALRGKHIDHLMRDLGWLTITGVHATKDREGERAAKFVEEVDAADRDGGGERLQIYAREGAAGLAEVTETGETTFVPITRVKTERRADAQRFRWYNVYALPEEHGGGEVRIRLTGNEEDERRKLNRAERLRAIPPPDPDFPALFRRRNDAESLNRGLEDTLYWRRAHSVGARAQEADLIGFGLGMNALAAFRHTKRGSLASAA